MADVKAMIPSIPGPILIVGANGFIGWNFFSTLARARNEVHGLAAQANWRTESAPELETRLHFENLGADFKSIVEELNPALIIDLASYGASADQNDPTRIARTNYERVQDHLQFLSERAARPMYLHAGSSLEYGFQCDGASENESAPNSLYALSQVAAGRLIEYFGTQKALPCLHLRLFSVYGPFETPTRLIPQLTLKGYLREWPRLSAAGNARDFIHIDDVLSAFLMCARRLNQTPALGGQTFNVGTGRQLSLKEVTDISRKVLNIPGTPAFGSAPPQAWDQNLCVANIEKIRSQIGWLPQVSFERGFEATAQWWKLDAPADVGVPARETISVLVTIGREDPDAAPFYDRVRAACERARVRGELISVDPTAAEGNDAVLWAALRQARGQACILISGDPQDPPESIVDFVTQWREGKSLVLGRRQTRAKWIFDRWVQRRSSAAFTPRLGDFALLDRQVVDDLLRGRAGYETSVVDYRRPERSRDRAKKPAPEILRRFARRISFFKGEPLRRWNRFLAFIALPGCLIAFVMLNYRREEEWPLFVLLFLGVATLGMIAEALFKGIESRNGEPRPDRKF